MAAGREPPPLEDGRFCRGRRIGWAQGYKIRAGPPGRSVSTFLCRRGGYGEGQGAFAGDPDRFAVPLAYLYSRYPVVSQTFCDSEMLALESMGVPLLIGSLNPPPTSFRHERLRSLKAEIAYPPPSDMLKSLPMPPALAALAEVHAKKYPAFKIERARNAAWFARVLAAAGVKHIHVHFANQATWTALFLKKAGFTGGWLNAPTISQKN